MRAYWSQQLLLLQEQQALHATQQSLVGQTVTTGSDEKKIEGANRQIIFASVLMIIAGDGVQEGAEQLAGFLQRQVGLHFTLALVEMSLWRSPDDGRVLVQPRILARTVQIERAVVRVEAGVALSASSIVPTSPASSKPVTLSETQVYEALAQISPELPNRLRAFLVETADFGGLRRRPPQPSAQVARAGRPGLPFGSGGAGRHGWHRVLQLGAGCHPSHRSLAPVPRGPGGVHPGGKIR